MHDELVRSGFIVHMDIDSVRVHGLLDGDRHLLCGEHDARPDLGRGRIYVFEMALWNHERMAWIIGKNVQKSHRLIILIYFGCWGIARYDLAKEAVLGASFRMK